MTGCEKATVSFEAFSFSFNIKAIRNATRPIWGIRGFAAVATYSQQFISRFFLSTTTTPMGDE
jgi:hypothetical protein